MAVAAAAVLVFLEHGCGCNGKAALASGEASQAGFPIDHKTSFVIRWNPRVPAHSGTCIMTIGGAELEIPKRSQLHVEQPFAAVEGIWSFGATLPFEARNLLEPLQTATRRS